MKPIFNAILKGVGTFLCLSMLIVDGQEERPREFALIRLVNAMAQGTGNLTLKINGNNAYDPGYKLGAITGGIAVTPGTHEVSVSKEGVMEGSTKVNAPFGSTTTIIPFAEKVPAKGDTPEYWEAKIIRLRQMEPIAARTITFVSVASIDELKVEIGTDGEHWETGYVKRKGLLQMPAQQAGGYTRLRIAGKELEPMAIPQEGNYVVIIYENDKGEVQSENFLDLKALITD
jgi:hypothetical protein